MSGVWHNVRYALRRLGRSPGFAASAIVSLSIGIGANTAIFSLVSATILQDRPLRDPEALVEIYESTPEFPWKLPSYPDFRDLRDSTGDVFSGVSATSLALVQVDQDDSIEMVVAETVVARTAGSAEQTALDMASPRSTWPRSSQRQSCWPARRRLPRTFLLGGRVASTHRLPSARSSGPRI